MKIAVLAAGSRGDVQPYLALALALQRAGHDAVFAASRNAAALARLHDIPFFPLDVDFEELAAGGRLRPALRSERPPRFLLGAFQTMPQVLRVLQEDAWRACQGVDVAIYHPLMLPNAFYVARHLGIPAIPACLYPLYPTRAHPALPFFTGPRLGSGYNLATHWITDRIIRLLLRPPIHRFWAQRLASGPLRELTRGDESEAHALYGYSERVMPRPADWPDRIHVTGFWFLEPPPGWQPPEDLVRFLEAGPAPVYIGFGSMGSEAQAARMTQVVIGAIGRADVRAVLSAGWAGLGRGAELPGSVLRVGDVPHAWLFPRIAAVVHHGGIGTTAAAFRAGVPSVIVPHTGDQPIWAKVAHELGVATPPIRLRSLTELRLSRAIVLAQADSALRARAKELGEQVRAEDGLASALGIIEDILGNPRRRPLDNSQQAESLSDSTGGGIRP